MALNKEESAASGDALAMSAQHMTPETEQVEFGQPAQEKSAEMLSGTGILREGKQIQNPEQKRHSEPIPKGNSKDSEERKCFERRRLWTASKQDSFDLPEDFMCHTEDNVFTETERSRSAVKGRPCHQRSLSMPATLPDVVPENAQFGDSSPDVLSNSEQAEVLKSILSGPSHKSERIQEGQEKKKSFEGSVHYKPTQEIKRKKSVTFETAAHLVSLFSVKGRKARTHFRSSGYGSQSDNSQASQGSNQSSEQGSVMSDDVLIETDSFEVDDTSGSCHSHSSTKTDGIIDGEEEGNCGEAEEHMLEKNAVASERQGQKPLPPGAADDLQGQETVDEIEQWRRQMSPKFHCGGAMDDDLPNLSIFNNQKDAIYYSTSGEDPCQLPSNVVENTGGEDQGFHCAVSQTTQASEKSADVVAPETGNKVPAADSPGHRTSPTTKEECQRELYKQLFEERMFNFDPQKESVTDLLEWVKKNIGEALTPSPKSPFFPAGGSPQHNVRIPQAVTGALQSKGVGGNMWAGLFGCEEVKPKPAAAAKPAAYAYPVTGQGGPQPHRFPGSQIPPHVYLVQGDQVRPVPQQGGFFPPRPASQQFDHFTAERAQGLLPPQPVPGVLHAQMPVRQLAPYHPRFQGQMGPAPQLYLAGPQPGLSQVDSRVPLAEGAGIGGRGLPCAYLGGLPTTLAEAQSLTESSYEVSTFDPSTGFGASHEEQLKELVNISQCSFVRCKDVACIQVRKGIHSLQEALKRGPSDLSNDDLTMMKLLCDHYNSCDLPNCHVPWCRYMSHRREKKTQQDLVSLLSYPLLSLLPSGVKCNQFVKMDESILDNSMPQEWKDWLVLCPLSHSYTIARAVLLPPRPDKHWTVKLTLLQEEGNQLDVYRKLRKLQSEHIIHHLWVASSSLNGLEHLVVCTEFLQGMSVRELLDQIVVLSRRQARDYMLQILSAVLALHEKHILYLNWTCSNLLLDPTCCRLKLTNFIASVDLKPDNREVSSAMLDTGMVKLTLPPDVVPAELLVQGGELGLNSDSWGLVCVLHEMLTGLRPWYHLRHGSREFIGLEIQKQCPPQLGADLPLSVQHIIHQCLQRSPEARLSAPVMMKFLQEQEL